MYIYTHARTHCRYCLLLFYKAFSTKYISAMFRNNVEIIRCPMLGHRVRHLLIWTDERQTSWSWPIPRKIHDRRDKYLLRDHRVCMFIHTHTHVMFLAAKDTIAENVMFSAKLKPYTIYSQYIRNIFTSYQCVRCI